MGIYALFPDILVHDGLVGGVWEAGVLSLSAGPSETRWQVLNI